MGNSINKEPYIRCTGDGRNNMIINPAGNLAVSQISTWEDWQCETCVEAAYIESSKERIEREDERQ